MSEVDVDAITDDEGSTEEGPASGDLHQTIQPQMKAKVSPQHHGNINGLSNPQVHAMKRKGQPQQGRTAIGQANTILPAEKVFPIQVGTELFRLSGASISSDGPSYFTQFFEEQVRQNEESGGVRTLYIDRDPVTFRDIARHLQGYYIKPDNGSHFVRLFADAQFYSLPRLIAQLFDSEIFIQIGEEHFQIPKDLFSDPGNSPNFFSLGFAVFFSTPNDVFPGLDKRGLLRPPPINPPHVPSRSSEVFSQLLHLLRGYPLKIRDEMHRAQLLRDCRYFHLRGLEQKIIAHDISYNLERKRSEICIRLDDIKPSGISYHAESREETTQLSQGNVGGGWVYYSRPFVDETPYELVLEIGAECSEIDLDEMRLDFYGTAKARITSLLQVIANKMNLPANAPLGLIMLSGGSPSPASSPGFSALSDDRVKAQFDSATALTLDGQYYPVEQIPEIASVPTQGTLQPEADTDAEAITMPATETPLTGKVMQKSGKRAMPTSTQGASKLQPPAPRESSLPPLKKRKLDTTLGKWVIRAGQWRLRVHPTSDPARSGYEIIFIAVKLDAFSSERARNMRREFLTG